MKNYFTSTLFLTNGLLVSGLAFLFAGVILLRLIFGSHYPDVFLNIVVAIGLLFYVFASIFVILRQEAPRTGGLPGIKGKNAVVIGALGLTIFGIAEIIILYQILLAFIK